MRNNELIFAKNVTIDNLNPHNFALKNEYITNLISTALNTIPYANDLLGVDSVVISNGFASYKYMNEVSLSNFVRNQKGCNNCMIQRELLFSKGLAIGLTWKDFDPNIAIQVAKNILLNNDVINIVIDIIGKKLNVYFNVILNGKPITKSIIEEKTTDGNRIVFIQE